MCRNFDWNLKFHVTVDAELYHWPQGEPATLKFKHPPSVYLCTSKIEQVYDFIVLNGNRSQPFSVESYISVVTVQYFPLRLPPGEEKDAK